MEDCFWKRLDQLHAHLFEYEEEKNKQNSPNIHRGLLDLSSFISQHDFSGFDILFTPGHPDINFKSTCLIRLAERLYKYGSVPVFTGREDCGFERSDFTYVTERSNQVLPFLSTLCKSLSCARKKGNIDSRVSKPNFIQKIALYSLLLIGQHSQNDLWTTAEVSEAAKKLTDDLLEMVKCESLFEMLGMPAKDSLLGAGIFQQIMAEIKPKLHKDNWKQSPAIPRIFVWIISHVKSPYMSEQIHLVLPPSLLLVDDHQAEYKVLGIRSLHLLMTECSREELRWHGRGEVIYEALQHQLYSNEADVLEVAMPALFLILEIIEGIPTKAQPPRPETRYDSILERLLQSMEMENMLVLRRIYVMHLPTFLSTMGVTLCRHLPRLLRVVAYYLEVYDGPTEEARFGALDVLEVIIKETWPRIPHHADTILKSLLKLVYDLSTDNAPSANVKGMLINRATECARLLRGANKQKVDPLIYDLTNIDFNEACAKFARAVLEEELCHEKTKCI